MTTRPNYQLLSDDALRKWESADDIGGDLFKHFSALSPNDWLDTSDEGVRIYNIALDQGVEKFSLIDSIFSAVAAESAYSAYKAVAKALGVDADDLEMAVSVWEEQTRSEPAGFEGLPELIEGAHRFHEELYK